MPRGVASTQPGQPVGVGRLGPAGDGRRRPRPTVGATRRLERFAGGDEGVAEGEVEVHRPGGWAEGLCRRPRRQRPPVARRAGGVVGHAHLGEPAHGVAVQLQLVDRLAGPGVPQLGRAVGGADDQRHPALVGLQHRRVEVGGRRPRRAEDHGRLPGGAGGAEGEEGGRPLVEEDLHPHPRVAGQGQRQRGGPRPGRHRGGVDAGPGPLVDQRAGHPGLGVDGGVMRSSPHGARGWSWSTGSPRRPGRGTRWRRSSPEASRSSLPTCPATDGRPASARASRRRPPPSASRGWQGELRRLLAGRPPVPAAGPGPTGAGRAAGAAGRVAGIGVAGGAGRTQGRRRPAGRRHRARSAPRRSSTRG